MDTQTARLVLERSRAMTGAQAVVRPGAARVASNRTNRRERAERTSARNRCWLISREALGRPLAIRSACNCPWWPR